MKDMETETGSSYGRYILTWLILLGLTAATVGVYLLHLGTSGALVALVIASVKASLILFFFMHLLQEGRFIKGIFLLPVLLIGVLIGLTFVDVWYR